MYSLLYVTTLHPEYLHVLQKAKKEQDDAKLEKLQIDKDKIPSLDWIEGFENGKGKSKNIDHETACYLELEKEAFEERIKKIQDDK